MQLVGKYKKKLKIALSTYFNGQKCPFCMAQTNRAVLRVQCFNKKLTYFY